MVQSSFVINTMVSHETDCIFSVQHRRTYDDSLKEVLKKYSTNQVKLQN